jgi:hypothetical protein
MLVRKQFYAEKKGRGVGLTKGIRADKRQRAVKFLKVAIQQYELVPEGVYAAVLADVVDLGEVATDFGKKLKGRFVYFLEETDSEGKQFRMFQTFTQSLNAKATLTKILGQLGVKVEGAEVDLETLVGKQCQLMVSHSDGEGVNKGKKFANITGITKPRMGQNVSAPDDFVRAKDRTDK